jgi:hypothetical protein
MAPPLSQDLPRRLVRAVGAGGNARKPVGSPREYRDDLDRALD